MIDWCDLDEEQRRIFKIGKLVLDMKPGQRLTRDDETGLWSCDFIAWGSLPTPVNPIQYKTAEEALRKA